MIDELTKSAYKGFIYRSRFLRIPMCLCDGGVLIIQGYLSRRFSLFLLKISFACLIVRIQSS